MNSKKSDVIDMQLADEVKMSQPLKQLNYLEEGKDAIIPQIIASAQFGVEVLARRSACDSTHFWVRRRVLPSITSNDT